MEPTTGFFTSLIEALKGKTGQKIMFVLFVTTAILLCRPKFLVANPGMANFIDNNWPGIVIGFIVSLTYFLFELGSWVSGKIGDRFRYKEGDPRPGNKLEEVFQALTENERAFLGEFIRKNRRTLDLPAHHSEIWALFKRKMIHPDRLYVGPTRTPRNFTISDDVWDYLQAESSRDPGAFAMRFPKPASDEFY